jgi:hypothetical protein
MKNSHTIHGFWSGSPLSPVNWACLKSFISKGHSFELYSYDCPIVPPGVLATDANIFIKREQAFQVENPSTGKQDWAPFSDYFRLKLLFEKGGWYCDVDTVCLANSLPKGPRVWARQWIGPNVDSVSNGQLYFERGDAVAAALLQECRSRLSRIDERETLGPKLFTHVLKKLSLPLDMGVESQQFYPITWIEAFKLWLPEFLDEVEERSAGAVFIPIFQSLMLYMGLEPHRLPPRGSYLGNMHERYAPERDEPSYSADDIRLATRKWLKQNESWAAKWLYSIGGPAVFRKLRIDL